MWDLDLNLLGTPKTSSFYYATLPGKIMSRSTNTQKSTYIFYSMFTHNMILQYPPITLDLPKSEKKKKKISFFFKMWDLRFRRVRCPALVKENQD